MCVLGLLTGRSLVIGVVVAVDSDVTIIPLSVQDCSIFATLYLEKVFCLFVHSDDRVFGDAEQPGNEAVLPLHLLLDQEEGNAVGLE